MSIARLDKSLPERQQELLMELEYGAKSYYRKFNDRAKMVLKNGRPIAWLRGGHRHTGTVVRLDSGLFCTFILVQNSKTGKTSRIRMRDYFRAEQNGLEEPLAKATETINSLRRMNCMDELSGGCDGNDDVA
jgi:hypothetical protein